ncbi:unnamed protein product [Mucor hiemalis]
MILRPSKIFVSLHQLRYYFQSKISELVVTSHPQPSSTVTQFANYSTTQQSIFFFSEIQRSLIQKAFYNQRPSQKQPINERLLLKVIQQHFPIVKVFSQPTLHGRNMMLAKAQSTQQLRTMMSSSGGTGGGNALLTWGLPRTAMVGVGRNNGFGATRQFSTTKSPTCINFFQTGTPQQPNIIAHISSRIFSPAGTKMNQPSSNEQEKSKFVPFYSREQDVSSGEESICSGDYRNSRMSSKTIQKEMGELFNNQQSESVKSMPVQAESTDASRHRNKRANRKMDHIIRHDEISTLHSEDVAISQKSKRKLRSLYATTRHCRTKHPPQRHQVKKKTFAKEDMKSSSSNNVYMLINLDSAPFLSTWSTQRLNSEFIDTIEILTQNYQFHIQRILNLLERLRFSGKKFRIVARQSELRIYFPASSHIQSEEEASVFLQSLQVDIEEEYFEIIVENDEDYFSYDHRNHQDGIGPDYFKDLQMFLDRTDYLIQTSDSTFSSSRQQ